MILAAAMLAILFLPSVGNGQMGKEPRSFFMDQIGLTSDQIASIRQGTPIVKVLPSNNPSELLVFGAVFVNATPQAYVPLALDLKRLGTSPHHLAVGSFGETPLLSDLQGFTLEREDIAALRSCQPGSCDVPLSSDAMRELRSVPMGPNLPARVNARMQKITLDLLDRYRHGGNRALGSYGDSADPFDIDQRLRALLIRSAALPVYLPELDSYLLEYPKLKPVRSLFFWEKVEFGLKTTLRLNHAIAFESTGPMGVTQVVAVKQLYASHYLQLALDLAACVSETGRPAATGFYLISLRGSVQQGLNGFTGSIIRRIIVSRTRSAQERMLVNIKQSLEHGK